MPQSFWMSSPLCLCAKEIAPLSIAPVPRYSWRPLLLNASGTLIQGAINCDTTMISHHSTSKLEAGTQVKLQIWIECSTMPLHSTNPLELGTQVKCQICLQCSNLPLHSISPSELGTRVKLQIRKACFITKRGFHRRDGHRAHANAEHRTAYEDRRMKKSRTRTHAKMKLAGSLIQHYSGIILWTMKGPMLYFFCINEHANW